MPRTFHTAARHGKQQERVKLDTFDIPTQYDDDGEPTETKTFTLYKPADSVGLMALNIATRLHEKASDEVKAAAVAAAIDFLGGCMDPGEHKTLYEIMVDPKWGMDVDQVIDMCRWALETVTKTRPTKRSTGSPAGRPRTGKKSTAASRSKASTR